MKPAHYSLPVGFFLSLVCMLANAQVKSVEGKGKFNPACNCYQPIKQPSVSLPVAEHSHVSRAGGISCNANTFWVVNSDYDIEEFQLNGGTASSQGIILTGGAGGALAFCNNLNGGSFSPTFYTDSIHHMPAYYNGSNWGMGVNSPMSIYNAGGNGNHLYYLGGDGVNNIVVSYNGSVFDTVFFDPALEFKLADLAVDDSGNIWTITGDFNSQHIDVISPAGQLLKRYDSYEVDMNNAYGCFMMNGVFYIGYGNANGINPNTLIPYTFAGDTAYRGTPISMPYVLNIDDYDLASCYAGAPLIGCSLQQPVITTPLATICSSGSAQICAPAGAVSYLWNNGQTANCITTSQAGNYYVTVTDISGCTAESNHLAISVYQQPPVSISVNGDTLSAYNAVAYQWYLNGNAISGQTDSVFIVNQAGSYTVAVTDTNGCTSTSNAIIITGIQPIAANVIQVSPNPFTDEISIVTQTPINHIILTDITGRKVMAVEWPTQHGQLPTSTLSRGVYFLQVTTTTGERVVKQMIKQ